MFLKIIIVLAIFFNFSVYAEENLLTVKQQLDRLQREVNDLSKIIFQNDGTNVDNVSNQSDSSNISAFDMRIYDLEKDIKNLNSSFEDLVFEIDEIKLIIKDLDIKLSDQIITNNSKDDFNSHDANQNESIDENLPENTLGTLKINSEDLSEESLEIQSENNQNEEKNLNPDEQFQRAFDLLRAQKFEKAKKALENFIESNAENDLSGSAHYWLGEIYLLKKDYREAALVFAEGYQKYSQSIKSPDMLYKLSEALIKIEKKDEACNTLSKFINDHPTNKLIENVNQKFQELQCI